MNNTAPQAPVPAGESLLSALEPMLRGLIESLRRNTIPPERDIAELQTVLRGYLDGLHQQEPAGDGPGTVRFEDCSGRGTTDAELTGELSRCARAGEILFKAASRKLIAEQSPLLSADGAQTLLQCGYLAPVEIRSSFSSGTFLTITSKGYRCFTRKGLAQQLRKAQGFPALPAGLRIPPEAWSASLFRKAILLYWYYERQGTREYLIFPAPQGQETLLGCAVPPAWDSGYSLAWIGGPDAPPQDAEYLRTLAGSPAVSAVTVVCPAKADLAALTAFAGQLPSKEKIHCRCLEVEDNGPE